MKTGERVLAVGQWLGTGNRIMRMEWFEKTGWTATDSTGERYQQLPSARHGLPGFRDGLKTADESLDCTGLPRTPWPPAPRQDPERASMMSARDEAINAMIDPRIVGHGWPLRDTAEAMIDAVPSSVLAQLAIERGGLEEAGVWDPPSFEDRQRVYYEDEDRPDDAVTLYRMVES